MKKWVIAGALLLLTGCAGPEAPEPVQITLMHGWGGSAPDHVAMRAIYDDFGRRNPDIRLLYDTSPDITVVLEKADNLLAVDRMPDIVSTNGFGNFVENARTRNKALNLAPYLEADPVFSADVNHEVLKTWMDADGALYTLPDALEVMGYWYNADILRKAGVDLPETFEELWEVCDEIAAWAQTTGADVMPMRLDADQARVFFTARLAADSREGAAFFQRRGLTSPPDGMENAITDLERAYSYYNGPVLGVNDARQLFFGGKSAFYFNGVWASMDLEKENLQTPFLCAAFPTEYGGGLSFVSSSSGYVIGNTGSPEKTEACVRFLKYMLSEEVQQRIAAETLQVPSNPKVTADWITGKAPVLGQALKNCYAAQTHILAPATVLESAKWDALQVYTALRHPTESQQNGLLSVFTRNSHTGKNNTTK